MANDWLVGNWLMLWTMAALSVLCGVFFLLAIVTNENNVACFQALATLLSMVGYTVGSLYWTAASYPLPEPSLSSSLSLKESTEVVATSPATKALDYGGNNVQVNDTWAFATVTTV